MEIACVMLRSTFRSDIPIGKLGRRKLRRPSLTDFPIRYTIYSAPVLVVLFKLLKNTL